jgi:hypothetical protein
MPNWIACFSSGWQSQKIQQGDFCVIGCQRNSQFSAVVISGSYQGDLMAGSPDVKASDGQPGIERVGLISPGGEQPGGP